MERASIGMCNTVISAGGIQAGDDLGFIAALKEENFAPLREAIAARPAALPNLWPAELMMQLRSQVECLNWQTPEGERLYAQDPKARQMATTAVGDIGVTLLAILNLIEGGRP